MKLIKILGLLLLATFPCLGQTPGTVRFPGNLDTPVSLFEAANRSTSTLNGAIGAGDTSLTLTSAATFPNSGAITINAEILYYTGKSANTLTGLIRGQCGTSASAQSNGAVVRGNIISCHHQSLREAIIAAQTKIGSSSSTPSANTFLVGTGAGTSVWQTLSGTAQTGFTIGSGTAKAGNTLSLFFSNDANKPGFRWNGSTLTVQFSNDGLNWFDVAAGTSGVYGMGTTGAIPKFTGATSVGASILTDAAGAVTAAGSLRASSRIAAGSGSSVGFPYVTANFAETFTDPSVTVIGNQNAFTLNVTGATSGNHTAVTGSITAQGGQNYNGAHSGGSLTVTHAGTGTLAAGIGAQGNAVKNSSGPATALTGVAGVVTTSGTGAVTDVKGLEASATLNGGAVTNWYGLKVNPPSGSAAVTNGYAIYLDADVDATNSFGIFSACADCKNVVGRLSIGNAGATYIAKHNAATATWDPPSVADGAMTSTSVTISQATIGDLCLAGFSNAVPAGALLTCQITALSTATVTLFNKTGGSLDLASGTLRAAFFQY